LAVVALEELVQLHQQQEATLFFLLLHPLVVGVVVVIQMVMFLHHLEVQVVEVAKQEILAHLELQDKVMLVVTVITILVITLVVAVVVPAQQVELEVLLQALVATVVMEQQHL
jgi:hypothetical protein